MNVTEATHTMTLLTWLTDPHQVGDQAARTACAAATDLADAAHARLGAGLTGAQITHAWPHLLTGCAGCPTCQDQP